jgi:hypothetical protein
MKEGKLCVKNMGKLKEISIKIAKYTMEFYYNKAFVRPY